MVLTFTEQIIQNNWSGKESLVLDMVILAVEHQSRYVQ